LDIYEVEADISKPTIAAEIVENDPSEIFGLAEHPIGVV
jgi:hypothetical protein